MMMHYYDFMREFVPALSKRLHSYVECSVEEYVEEVDLWVSDYSLSVDIDYNEFEDFVWGGRSSFVVECEDYGERREFVVECVSTDAASVADAVVDAFRL